MAEERGCALLLLAAGGSLRMGEPKQLLNVGGEPLIRRAARTALAAGLHPNIVVIGAHAARIRQHLADLSVDIVENPHWTEGLASSLRVGVASIVSRAPQVHGLIVMLADQPRLTAAHLKSILAARLASGRSVVASDYGAHLGPPAYFAAGHFPALQALQGDVGARGLLRAFDALPVAVPADAAADLDTPADYARLIESPPIQR